MIYFKIEDYEYCLSWEYIKIPEIIAFAIENNKKVSELLGFKHGHSLHDYARKPSPKERIGVSAMHVEHEEYPMFVQDQPIITNCVLSHVVKTDEGTVYNIVSVGECRRSAKDQHNKKLAYKISFGRLIKSLKINDFDEAFINHVKKAINQ